MSAQAWPRRAVVDIGSNSVRLVIFSGPPRVPVTITNEKALCGLGDRDPETGNLREEAADRALTTLRRFHAVIETEEPETLDVFATAAVREAPNGRAFLESIREIGFEPRLISGEEEARLAGLGILCSAPEIIREKIRAIGGDLGGGSLELSLLGGTRVAVDRMISLPLGSLRMTADYGDDLKTAEKNVRRAFGELPWLSETPTPHLYIVGGSWRAIARVGMHLSEHPLAILDHYMMHAEQALEVCRFVEEADLDELMAIDGVQKKRAPNLAMAAVVLRVLIEHADAKKVVVSSCGVREGLLFDRLPDRIRREEPAAALAADLADRQGGGRRPSATAVTSFTEDLFADEPSSLARIRRAAARMIRVANMTHPDKRPGHAAAIVMTAPFLGIDHIERAALALMMMARFNGDVETGEGMIPLSILPPEIADYAIRVGYAHRLAASLRTPLYTQRSGFELSLKADKLRLNVAPQVAAFVVETGLKDLGRLADAFGVEAVVQTAED
jgi:exopolyphosphatase/guanosine-5'-triphosphate,3'-diphosphate pyrophosphatase